MTAGGGIYSYNSVKHRFIFSLCCYRFSIIVNFLVTVFDFNNGFFFLLSSYFADINIVFDG